jgi:hypothetical protein
VSWWYVPRGGYGWGHWVPAQVVRQNPKTVRIRVLKRDRVSWREINARPEKLKPRATRIPEDG